MHEIFKIKYFKLENRLDTKLLRLMICAIIKFSTNLYLFRVNTYHKSLFYDATISTALYACFFGVVLKTKNTSHQMVFPTFLFMGSLYFLLVLCVQVENIRTLSRHVRPIKKVFLLVLIKP